MPIFLSLSLSLLFLHQRECLGTFWKRVEQDFRSAGRPRARVCVCPGKAPGQLSELQRAGDVLLCECQEGVEEVAVLYMLLVAILSPLGGCTA